MTMKRKAIDFYLGLFVLAGLVAIGFMILYFGGMSTRNRYKITVLFDDVAGLIEEAPVRYKGVECGSVRRIAVGTRRGAPDIKVEVVLSLDDNIILRADDEVKVTPVSFLGEMAVQIVPGPLDAPELPKDGTAKVVGANPIGILDPFAKLLGPFPEVMENIRILTDKQGALTETVEGLSRAVNQTLPDVANDIRVAVRTVSTSTESLLAENREQISGLIASMEGTLQSSSGFIENLNRLTAEKGLLTGVVKDLKAAVDDYRRVAHALHPVIQNIRTGEGGLGKFITDRTWYDNFNKLLMGMTNPEYSPLHHGEFFEKQAEREKRSRREPMVSVR